MIRFGCTSSGGVAEVTGCAGVGAFGNDLGALCELSTGAVCCPHPRAQDKTHVTHAVERHIRALHGLTAVFLSRLRMK
jgi:predicted small metal-binding protein